MTNESELSVKLRAVEQELVRRRASDRLAKYNELLRIEDALGDTAKYAGRDAFRVL